jgi:hypothetical protein
VSHGRPALTDRLLTRHPAQVGRAGWLHCHTRAEMIRNECLYRFAYFTLFIHFRIGPVTVSSAVLGAITSEMWL